MYKSVLVFLFYLFAQVVVAQNNKHRLLILADMGNEPDEVQQMVHMIMYSNEFDLEGLIAVSGKFLHSGHHLPERRKLYPELFHDIIDAYQNDLKNLKKHADGWPDPEYLRSIVFTGQPDYGMQGVKRGKSTPGSEFIIKAVSKDDPRPLNIVVNAGSNTLAQAIIDYESQHTKEELAAFLKKMQVFENGAQDNAGAWICAKFPEIHWLRSNYQTYCYGGPDTGNTIGGEIERYKTGPYTWEPYGYSFLGQHQWALEHLKFYHGWLGKTWPLRQMNNGRPSFLEGGGTIPWLGLVHQGLSDLAHPHWGGWSGRFTREKAENVWSRHQSVREDEQEYGEFALYTEASDRWEDPENEILFNNVYAPVWRWRRAMYNDFRCRMDWCVQEYENANHPPVAAINGDKEEKIHIIHAKPGHTVQLDASASSDPDGDEVLFKWWIYQEAGTYSNSISLLDVERSFLSFSIPDDAQGKEIHLILEIKDQNKIASMYDYRRVVLAID